MTAPASKLREALEVAADQIAKQRVIIEAQNELLSWALGFGPLPCDEEAERAAWAWLRVAVDAYGARDSKPFFDRAWPLLTTRCPDEAEEPSMRWSEAVARLQAAWELRVSLWRIKQATRRALSGDRVGTIRALRGAVDVFGEPRASAPVELQWRIAELESELRELQAVKAGLAG